MNSLHNPIKLSAADAMAAAIQWLRSKNVDYKQLTLHHLKMGRINFWPITGVITVDGENSKREDKGLASLESILISECLIKNKR